MGLEESEGVYKKIITEEDLLYQYKNHKNEEGALERFIANCRTELDKIDASIDGELTAEQQREIKDYLSKLKAAMEDIPALHRSHEELISKFNLLWSHLAG